MSTPKILVGKKITLKLLDESFFQEYHQQFSPTVRRAIGLQEYAPLQETEVFLASRLTLTRENKILNYCVFDNQDNVLIGDVELRMIPEVNGQLGAWINECYWGGGRYQEVLDLTLPYYFTCTKASSISIFVAVNNIRSLKAHQKYGFKIAGEFVGDDKMSSFYQKRVFELVYEEF